MYIFKLTFCHIFLLDWRTHCAKALYDHRKYAQAIVINWGGLSCKNYNCLVTRCIRPIGELLGKMFAEKFNPRLVTLVGQSIAGQRRQIDTFKNTSHDVNTLDCLQLKVTFLQSHVITSEISQNKAYVSANTLVS